MNKSYANHLRDWVSKQKKTRREKNLAAFLAVREDVQEALDAGFSVKTIWSDMHEHQRVAFGYQAFLGYVKRYVQHTAAATATATATGGKIPDKPPPRPAPSTSPRTLPEKPAGFVFNPIPNKEELL